MPRVAEPPVRYSDLITKLQTLLRVTARDGRFTPMELEELRASVGALTRVLGDVQARPMSRYFGNSGRKGTP
jgi:hypothetical protein